METHKTPKKRKDKSDNATVSSVIDKKTLNILKSLERRNLLTNLEGCISTGKESCIYIGDISKRAECRLVPGGDEGIVPAAIKIFKTSRMTFKDREKYIRSEKRYETYCCSNPRKLIKLWAEKEVRNLKRLMKAGIPVPEPIYLKRNVLIMSLIGTKEEIAPRLKDIKYTSDNIQAIYDQCIDIIRRMYNKASLVHADLSEYNLLLYQDKVVVIDVGQSVETTHDYANEFLINDIKNINNFFMRLKANIIENNILFENITGLKIPSCLDGIEITNNVYIPESVCDVRNKEDYKYFTKESKSEESNSSNNDSDSSNKDSNEDSNNNDSNEDSNSNNNDSRNDEISKKIKKLEIKERRKEYKEKRREQRTMKVKKKVKRRLKKIYKRKKRV
ncbi:putative serine/threonine-protein kinase RIO1 like protein [Astathelohania contejeani]|uniref:non-specific serine/threonine protein kinase n=1 Tax=Astathelohania contejeani TaxID=164912 RepID=A0ABQ7HYU5_9MICR|nr:putative serine/threonine-protein kinase RIO1 like protein [Thelohania contejeani]